MQVSILRVQGSGRPYTKIRSRVRVSQPYDRYCTCVMAAASVVACISGSEKQSTWPKRCGAQHKPEWSMI